MEGSPLPSNAFTPPRTPSKLPTLSRGNSKLGVEKSGSGKNALLSTPSKYFSVLKTPDKSAKKYELGKLTPDTSVKDDVFTETIAKVNAAKKAKAEAELEKQRKANQKSSLFSASAWLGFNKSNQFTQETIYEDEELANGDDDKSVNSSLGTSVINDMLLKEKRTYFEVSLFDYSFIQCLM